jgi:hypothetical protein
MKTQYFIKLTDEERIQLQRIKTSTSNKISEQLKKRAKVILCLDLNGEKPLTPELTAKKCKVHPETVYKFRKEFCVKGIKDAIIRKKRETPPVPPKVTGDVEAHIIAVACSEPPEGRNRWTLLTIAEKIMLDGVVDYISDVTIMKTLKKRNISLT